AAPGSRDTTVAFDARELRPPIFAMAGDRYAVYAADNEGLLRIESTRVERILDSGDLPGPIRGLALRDPDPGSAGTAGDPWRAWLVGDGWVAGIEAAGEPLAPGAFEDGGLELLTTSLPPLSVGPGRIDVAPDRAAGVYIADPQNVLHVDGEGRISRLGVDIGLAMPGGRDLEVDREGLLWVAGTRGVSKLTARRFTNLGRRHGLLEDEVTAIGETPDGTIVLGHNHGFTLLGEGSRPSEKIRRTLRLPVDQAIGGRLVRVMDISVAEDGTVWAAVTGLGILRRGPDGSERWYGPEEGVGAALCCVALGPKGEVWAAGSTHTDGTSVFRLRGERFVGVELEPRARLVRRLAFAEDGRLLVASQTSGLFVRQPNGAGETWRHIPPPGDSQLFNVLPARDGDIWLGASDGLYLLVDGRLDRASNVELHRPVFSLAEDRQDRLWIGTDHGVYRWDGNHLRHYGPREGLAGLETNRDALFLDSSQRMWIGTHLGVSRFEARFDRRTPLPEVAFEELDAEGFRFRLTGADPVRVPAGTRTLIFRFRSPSYYDEEALLFSARLEGFEPDFPPAEIRRTRQIRYTSLPPGEYRLHLRARLPEGTWGPVIVSPPIRVVGPLWQRTWFLAVVALGSIGLVGASALAIASRNYSRILADQVRERTLQLEASTARLADAAAELRREVAVRRRTEAELREAKDVAESASSAKSRFLATMSHEIRTPLSGALGMIALLERSRLAARQLEHMGILRRSVEALLGLLDDILDYSKIEAGRLELHLRSFDPRDLVREVVALFQPGAANRDLELRLEIDPGVPEMLDGDPQRLRQVLSNLIGNAIKFTERGSIVVSLTAPIVPPSQPGDTIEIRVSDTGIGIPAGELDSLFEPFRQVDSSHRRRFGGTGLGLAICDQLVRAMGGTLEATSSEGEGSSFSVRLPALSSGSESREAAKAAPPDDLFETSARPYLSPAMTDLTPSPAAGAEGGRQLRVLLAEDNPVNQLIVRELLGELGHRVEVAENGLEVLERLEGSTYDLVLMDVQMPEMDGLEASRKIVGRWGSDRPRIVALTAHALRGDREECLEAGMDDYLSKPVSMEALEAVLTEAAERR
ncbi:MAG: ATP-binding protein, partial [Holophagales bacterium]|nr:ATP-binding protein [Holophagales bacterium]